MQSKKETSSEVGNVEQPQTNSEKVQAELKLSTINIGHINSAQPKPPVRPRIPNILCRPVQSTSQATGAVEQSLGNTPAQARGNIQVSFPTQSIFPPHLWYGYVPAYHGFLNNSFTEYLTLDPTLFLRRQKPRTIFSADQLKILEATFKENSYPSASTRKQVANKIGLPVDRVRVWFQNRRAKEKRLKEDRLALTLLTENPAKNMSSTSRLHSELLLQKLGELKSPEKHEAVEVDVESISESEEEIVRTLLREARAREEARNDTGAQKESLKCCTESRPDSDVSCSRQNESVGRECTKETFCTSEEDRKHTEELANKMYIEHLRMLQELEKASEKSGKERAEVSQ